jgi:predicted peroxiredoxin
MNESGATAFEVRDMAKRIERNGVDILLEYDDRERVIGEETLVERAIIVEALTLLAEKKEAERRQPAQ